MPTDEKLMHLVQQGDTSHMGELFSRYHVKMYNFFIRQGVDRVTSEDLTQNVFERALKYKSSFNHDYSFKTWLYRIATNISYDHTGQKKIKIDSSIDYEKIGAKMMANDPSLESEERIIALHQAMNQLNHEDQKVIFLSKSEKMKYSQIAITMNTTEAAVKVKVHRAIKSLYAAYNKLENQ